jgi:hypothetical protein
MKGTLGSAAKPASLRVWLARMRTPAKIFVGRAMWSLDVPQFPQKTAF